MRLPRAHAEPAAHTERSLQSGDCSFAGAPDAPLQHLRAVEIPDRWEKQANAGGKIPAKDLAEDVPEEENLRAYLDGQFQGILHRSGEMLVWKMHF